MTFTPGATIAAEQPARPRLRLSFGLLEPEELDEGVRRLARALRRSGARRGRVGATAPLS